MITLTIHITHPDVVRGDARTAIYNSVAQTLEALGPDWNHVITQAVNGNLIVKFHHHPMLPSGNEGQGAQVAVPFN